MDGVRFVVDRSSEGNYTCGLAGSISEPVTIVARPNGREDLMEQTFYADVGSTARLDCSITPGALPSLYYITWRNASDPSVIFYQIFPPLGNGQQETFNPDTRYSIDVRNFSLLISDVELRDADDYQCILGVVDPTIDRDYEYIRTQDVNISLSIFKAPRFVQNPASKVVRNATNITFVCAVVSSPEKSRITWSYREGTYSARTQGTASAAGRFSVEDEELGVDRGRAKQTTSHFTIFNVTGYDSDFVECFSEYSVNTVVLFNVTKKVKLSVLDAVQLNTPIRFQSGGFILPIVTKGRLLISVRVQLLFRDAENPSISTLIRTTATYFNITRINHIVFNEQVPYDSFYVSASLFYEDVEGPFTQHNRTFSRTEVCTCDEGFKISFCVDTTALIIILLGIVLIFIVAKVRTLCCHNNQTADLAEGAQGMQRTIDKANNIVCCNCSENVTVQHCGSNDVEDGFTAELAEGLVENLQKVITYCKGNLVIARVMKERKIIISSPGADGLHIGICDQASCTLEIEEAKVL